MSKKLLEAIRRVLPRFRKLPTQFAIVAALALLLAAGAGALLAAPRSPSGGKTTLAQSTSTAAATGTATKRTLSHLADGSTPTTTATDVPTATTAPGDTPTPLPPTPTSPPAPTATLGPTPTQVPPTPTPAPSWHTVGTYSGTGPENDFVTVSGIAGDTANIEVEWTCDDSAGPWEIGFETFSVSDPTRGDGGTVPCGGPNGNLSGTSLLSAYTADYGPSWTISMYDTTDAGGPWTATVLIWY